MKKIIIITLWFAIIMSACAFANQAKGNGIAATKYPILLVHGWSGFGNRFGVDYFYGIVSALKKNGADVYAVEVSPYNSSEFRGEQLYLKVQSILSLTGAKKVNLIGHSHGAMTSRYVASNWPKKVASVISVGGVNWGSRAFDIALNAANSSTSVGPLIIKQLNLIASVLNGQPLSNIDNKAAYYSLSTKGSLEFNQKYPEGVPKKWCGSGKRKVNGVRYYSWTGHSASTYNFFLNPFDPSDYAFNLIDKLVYKPVNQVSDGLVPVCGSHLGKVLRRYDMTHLDEINQVLGMVSPFEVSPVSVYLKNAAMLKRSNM